MYARKVFTKEVDFYQGDIIDDFPLFIFTEDFNLLDESEPKDNFKIRKVETISTNPKKIIGAFPVELSRVIILSQTCDIKNNNTVIVAPVYSLSAVIADGLLSEPNTKLVSKRRGAMKDWFYLPAIEGVIGESFVDFQKIHYSPKKIFEQYREKRVIALSDWGIHLFSWAISDYFGRPIEDKYRTD